jgi:hypothetical protein
MTSPETSDLYANVQNNNNIVWKNISIVDTDGDGMRFADFVIGNFGGERRQAHFLLETPKRRGASLFDWGHVMVEFRGELARWAKKGIKGEGFEQIADGRLFIAKSGVQLQSPQLERGKFGTVRVQFVPDGRRATGAQVFELDVAEIDNKGKRMGGQRLVLKTTAGQRRPRWDHQLDTFDGVTWMPKRRGGCGCDCG